MKRFSFFRGPYSSSECGRVFGDGENTSTTYEGFTRFQMWFTGFGRGTRRTEKWAGIFRPRYGPIFFGLKPAPRLLDRCRTGNQSRLEVTCTRTRIAYRKYPIVLAGFRPISVEHTDNTPNIWRRLRNARRSVNHNMSNKVRGCVRLYSSVEIRQYKTAKSFRGQRRGQVSVKLSKTNVF